MTERELCIGLNMVSGLGFSRYQALIETFGTPDAVRLAKRGERARIPGVGGMLAERIVCFDWDSEWSVNWRLPIAEM